MNNYNPSNWYWLVNAGPSNQVFSSYFRKFVPTTDTTYMAWITSGNQPTVIANGAELYEVMAQQVIPQYFANGIRLESTSKPSLNATYPLDAVSQGYMTAITTGVNAGQLPGGGTTFVYNGVTFNGQQFLAVAAGLMGYIYDFNSGLATYLVSDGADGSLPSIPVIIA